MKKINFLGIEFNVVDEDDLLESARTDPDGTSRLYMMRRVADGPLTAWPELAARIRKRPCSACGELCWLDPASFAQVKPYNPELICIPCLMARTAADPNFKIAPEVTAAATEAIYRINSMLADGGFPGGPNPRPKP